jgi:hypothetical protein
MWKFGLWWLEPDRARRQPEHPLPQWQKSAADAL